MKNVLMMVLRDCPYCHQAFRMMDELKKAHPEYENVTVRVADEEEEKELADSLDYYYVPTYFVDGEKIHEGVPTPEKVRAVYEAALGR
ncbi:MAG TPA: thioredoxin family protein [Candidatus Limivivens intestinipullorum]|uniref:Thioredoxin family protein n=1 Tax=Candidatus Limivivens intestinipullorum TaxID=2840858 RepID=A0A9D1ERC6_9FIRM|nr:thioredoxin family protein [Candidatus Limivivens intestinipullorum]